MATVINFTKDLQVFSLQGTQLGHRVLGDFMDPHMLIPANKEVLDIIFYGCSSAESGKPSYLEFDYPFRQEVLAFFSNSR